MRIDLVVHILAGAVGIVSGFVALFVVKGATVHRRGGRIFVYAMLTMSILGTLMAAVRGVAPSVNVPAGMTTAYLVITALTTVSPPVWWSRKMDVAVTLVAAVFGVTTLTFGFAVLTGGFGERWMLFPLFLFGTVSLLATMGDIRIIRSGAPKGGRRLSRHLWRMCFALFIASASFFLGQARIIPEEIRIYPLLAIPVLTPLLAIAYWVWRVRARRTVRGMIPMRAVEPA
jgi:hypothetical protein